MKEKALEEQQKQDQNESAKETLLEMMRKLTYPTSILSKNAALSLTEQARLCGGGHVAREIDSRQSRSTNIWPLAVVKFTVALVSWP